MNTPQKRKNDDTCPSRKRFDLTGPDSRAEPTDPDSPAGSTVPNTPTEFTDISTGGRHPEVITTLGDVILELIERIPGQGLRKVLVSSVVLSHASPVFSIMFCHGSYAGHALSTSSPHTVPLPGDDPKSIFLICLITRFKTFQLPDTLNVTEFANFAYVCHKYSCTEAVQTHSLIWLSFLLQNPEDADFEKLILATHFFDLHQSFNKITRSIIRDWLAITDIATAMKGHERLPVTLFEKVGASQILCQKQVEEALGAIVNEKDACDWLKLRVGTVFHTLVSGGMWHLVQQSIKKIRDRLTQVGTPITKTLAKFCESFRCNCKSAGSLNARVVRKLDQMYADVKGTCLDCAQ